MERPVPHQEAVTLLTGALGARVVEAQLGYGSFVTIDFSGERRANKPRGYYLWIYMCYWRLETTEEVVASCEDPRDVLAGLVPRLNGKTLTAVEVERPSLSTVFRFEDLVLKTFSISSAESEHYMFFVPGGDVLSSGPGEQWSLEVHSEHG